ncbi:ABC transporter ATP-binding protein [Pseudonocardia kunmingensis]|uniref:NitT/TauT family transport system ATP-binding protein n=1 Tax=Pseudonocardia kunmingensis TaxID=630975 RepID=A0A543DNZ2_9PSEU|nr:ABC transporter ATP-binding protein [Pseudonocardia kunmingensis]TQM11039.1 NitT/TauT family transport system ATP-binding protein [Pseudonocardia kunmingensis]
MTGARPTGTAEVPTLHGPGSPSLECRDLLVRLTGATGAVDILKGVDLTIAAGEFVSVLGASGTGKTTLLRVLGGLTPSTDGAVLAGGVPVSGPPDGVVTVFQDYTNSLLPWRTVRRNVALGVEDGLSKEECTRRVDDALEMVGLTASAQEYPFRLSGGMQQRVQIARALAMRPSVLLMDEPFGALDAMTKASLQDQLQRVQSLTGTAVVFVTHDVEEAVYLSDRVVVLSGRPAGIGLTLDVDLPRPRDQIGTKETPEYLDLRHRVYAALGHEVAR